MNAAGKIVAAGIYSQLWCLSEIAGNNLRFAIDMLAPDSSMSRDKSKSTVNATTNGKTAVIDISGTLTKYPNFLTGLIFGTPTTEATIAVQNAADDPDVDSILLAIESPGGESAGTQQLADAVYQARQKKPVIAYIDDMGCSAAYWAASQADQIFANKSAIIGSIGTYTVLRDFSAMFAANGVKVHVIKSTGADNKGAGVPGTAVTDDMLAEIQRMVDGVNDQFVQSVARGRGIGLTAAKKLADGKVHIGDGAKTVGLVDQIGSMSDALAALRKMPPKQATSSAARSDAATIVSQTEPPRRERPQAAIDSGPDEFKALVRLATAAAKSRGGEVNIADIILKCRADFPDLAAAFDHAHGNPKELFKENPMSQTTSAGDDAGALFKAKVEERFEKLMTVAARRLRGGDVPIDRQQICKLQAVVEITREEPELHQQMIDQATAQENDRIMRRSGRGPYKR